MGLHLPVIGQSRLAVARILFVEPGVYFHVSLEWRPVLSFGGSTGSDVAAESSPERRNIVSISSSLCCSWRFLVVRVGAHFGRSFISSRVLHVALVVGPQHISAAS